MNEYYSPFTYKVNVHQAQRTVDLEVYTGRQ